MNKHVQTQRTTRWKEHLEGIDYEIRALKQAKRMTLKVAHDGRVWVSMPVRASVQQARAFVRQHVEYLRSTLAGIAAEQKRTESLQAEKPLRVPVRGVWHKVECAVGEQLQLFCEVCGDVPLLRIVVPPLTEESVANLKKPDSVQSAAMRYWRYMMILQANKELPERTLYLAASVGETLKRVSVRDQRSLWGSCVKARRSISLNWRCVLFPDDVRDYLILHELAHLRHANHSAEYWNHVESWCADYRTAEAWLKENGREIMRVTAR